MSELTQPAKQATAEQGNEQANLGVTATPATLSVFELGAQRKK